MFMLVEQTYGTSCRTRTHADYQSVFVFQNMSSDLQHQCLIRDSCRLGKYKQDSLSPCPLLVTMNLIANVFFILSHCRSLPSVFIRPDLTESQRKACDCDILLRERRNRLVAGVQSGLIKIRGSKLFVSGALSGSVVEVAFVPAVFNDAPAALNDASAKPNDASVDLSDSAPPLSLPLVSLALLDGRGLSVCLWKSRSIVNKSIAFKSFLFSSDYKMVAVTETWLNLQLLMVKSFPPCRGFGQTMLIFWFDHGLLQ